MEEFNLAWWISVIGLPLVGTLFGVDYMLHSTWASEAKEIHERISKQRDAVAAECANMKDGIDKERRLQIEQQERLAKELTDFRMFVLTNYASQSFAKEIEARLVSSLGRIEERLESIDMHLRPHAARPQSREHT